jgi:hypothetical protein
MLALLPSDFAMLVLTTLSNPAKGVGINHPVT